MLSSYCCKMGNPMRFFSWHRGHLAGIPPDLIQSSNSIATVIQNRNRDANLSTRCAHWAQPGAIRHASQRRIQTLKVIPVIAVRPLTQEHLVAFVGVEAIAYLASVVLGLRHSGAALCFAMTCVNRAPAESLCLCPPC